MSEINGIIGKNILKINIKPTFKNNISNLTNIIKTYFRVVANHFIFLYYSFDLLVYSLLTQGAPTPKYVLIIFSGM